MPDENFHELLGDDGEFKEPVDSGFGVYSLHRHGYWWRISAAMFGMFACALIAVVVWYF
jgi:hypothetical protein